MREIHYAQPPQRRMADKQGHYCTPSRQLGPHEFAAVGALWRLPPAVAFWTKVAVLSDAGVCRPLALYWVRTYVSIMPYWGIDAGVSRARAVLDHANALRCCAQQ